MKFRTELRLCIVKERPHFALAPSPDAKSCNHPEWPPRRVVRIKVKMLKGTSEFNIGILTGHHKM